MDDPARIVEVGYDALGEGYRDWAASFDDPTREAWVGQLARTLPDGSFVLDAGCGPGSPTGAALMAAGHFVVGIDRSTAQLGLARAEGLGVLRSDLVRIAIATARCDAVVALYSLTHLVAERQPVALAELARVTRPGGHLVATLSAGSERSDGPDHWLGVDTWFGGHPPAANRRMLDDAGWQLDRDEIVTLHEPDGDTRFHWIRATRRSSRAPS